MDDSRSLASNQQVDATCIEAALGTVVDAHSAYYVSTPITSGSRFIKWRSATGLTELDATYVDEHRRHVSEVNRAEVQPFVQALRRRLSVPVIDPTALGDIPGWTQPDYRHLWGRILEHYVDTAVFMYGWEYSSGCTYEFLVAKKAGVNTVDGEMSDISVADGLRLLTTAISDYHLAGIPMDFLKSIERELAALSDGRS